MSYKPTLDDLDPVIDPVNIPGEPLTNPNQVKPRSRSALEVYDEIQARKLEEQDFD